jgi:hypothetical protein
LLAPLAARAQLPPDTLIGGQVQAAIVNNSGLWCYVGQGTSTFQRNGTNSTAVISFPELVYYDGTYHPLGGQARLNFSSATTGDIKFKFWGANGPITDPNFSGYSETFNGQQYIITFTIAFPNNCSLPIFAGYETP